MVTTIKIDTVEKGAVPEVYARAIEEFEKLTREENCQILSVTASEVQHSFAAHKQVITIVWTGTSNKIKSSYRASHGVGLFPGTVSWVELV
ncbi:MAG: hypothetical protein IJ666_04755 [Ruminococcus sp.]|nr:hypothetical protein [Ruminococcus sp.]